MRLYLAGPMRGLEHGFTPSPRPGFVGMERRDEDGRTVQLDVFN